MESKYPGKLLPILLLLPTLIASGMFLYYPAVKSFQLSMYKTLFLGAKKVYTGFDNFVNLLTSPDYLQTVAASFIFSASVVIGGLVLGLGIALLANRKVRGARFYRVALIWPYALSPAVAGTIWLFLFNPSAGMMKLPNRRHLWNKARLAVQRAAIYVNGHSCGYLEEPWLQHRLLSCRTAKRPGGVSRGGGRRRGQHFSEVLAYYVAAPYPDDVFSSNYELYLFFFYHLWVNRRDDEKGARRGDEHNDLQPVSRRLQVL